MRVLLNSKWTGYRGVLIGGMTIILLCLGPSSEAQKSFDNLDQWMEAKAADMGGRTILLIFKDDRVIYNKSVNKMNGRQKMINKYVARKEGKDADMEAYGPESREMMASCSKWYSAALVMTFVDEGKLGLNDTVGTWLPVLSSHGKGNITVAQCLSHMTGIKTPPLKESLRNMKNIHSMDQAIEEIAEMPMEGKPGEIFHYSNAGLQIAGAVIEKISGKSFENLFAERIAIPIGMKNSDFGRGMLAFPAGGARSTPEDYLDFLVTILHHGYFNGKRILSENSIYEMEINRVLPGIKVAYSPGEAEGLGYGYGEWVVKSDDGTQPGKWVTSPGLFGSFPWVDNEHQYCAFLMTFNLNFKDRHKRYFELKQLVDQSVL